MQIDRNALQLAEYSIEMVEYSAAGSHRRPPLLFVHGAYTAAWCWAEHFLPYFAAHGYRAFALSLRGHGESGSLRAAMGCGVFDYLADVDCAVDHVLATTGRAPVLVGHSMGGFLGLMLARERRCAGLALLATVPPEGSIGSAVHLLWRHPRVLWELGAMHRGGPAPELATLREMLFSPDLPKASVCEYARRFCLESERALLEMAMPQIDLRPPLGHPPALVLIGRADALIPAHLGQSAAHFLGVRANVIDRVGHLMMLDAHWQSAAAPLLQWLEELP